jgi:hypothetical protein
MAMQMAMRCAQSELNRKISADERYNKNVTQGVSSFSEVCQKISMDEQGMYVCYIAIRVTRKDLENQTEELDSINVLQEK